MTNRKRFIKATFNKLTTTRSVHIVSTDDGTMKEHKVTTVSIVYQISIALLYHTRITMYISIGEARY